MRMQETMRVELPETAYFGRLTASMTHELSNVLAIIGESSGLMEDVLEMAGDFPNRETFERRLAAIREQLGRGQRLCAVLNGFAHVPDARPCEFDPSALTAQVVGLAIRAARLAEVALTLGDITSHRMVADPMALHMALHAVMEAAWRQLPPGSSMRVDCGPNERGFGWYVAAALPDGSPAQPYQAFEDSVAHALARARLGLEAEAKIEAGRTGLGLNLWTLSNGDEQ